MRFAEKVSEISRNPFIQSAQIHNSLLSNTKFKLREAEIILILLSFLMLS